MLSQPKLALTATNMYNICVRKSLEHLKKFKNWPRPLVTPRTDHACHQKPNSSRAVFRYKYIAKNVLFFTCLMLYSIYTVYLQQYIVLNLLYLSYHVFCEKYEYIEHSRVNQRLRACNYEKPRGSYVLLK